MHTKKLQRFENREDAGHELAIRLMRYTGLHNVAVLAFPRGGVPVGAEVAAYLNKPFDILLVRKIPAPGHDGVAMGAITGGGVRILDYATIDRLHLSDAEIKAAILKESLELAWRENLYRGDHPALDVADRTVILVDDGATAHATIVDAIHLLRRQHADRIVVAVPALCRDSAYDLRQEADEVVTLAEPAQPVSTPKCFKRYPLTTDAEVRGLLTRVAYKNCA
jgi:putative phosphoribosyl transferase